MLHWIRTSAQPSCQLWLVLLLGCARSGLDPSDLDADPGAATEDAGTVLRDAGGDAKAPLPSPDVGRDAGVPLPPSCVPEAERCNGSDDDCNGHVDDLTPAACPGGGFRYCIAGRESACPERCESCVPGSERVCFVSYCTFWGIQTCAADGRGFGICQEQRAPGACSRYATGRGDIDRLEQCCIDSGYCCVDEEDLDRDGDRREMLGRCDHVVCR